MIIPQTRSQTKEVSLKFIVAVLLFVAALFLFAFLADEVVLENEDLFDSRAFHFFQSLTTPGIIKVMSVVSFFGSPVFFLPAYVLLVVYFLIKRKHRYALDIGIVGVSSTALMFALKNIFHRQRPPFPVLGKLTNYSFPSGHALCSFIFCSVVIYIVWNTNWSHPVKWILSILLLLFSISIGISRIVLRYHYASDVLAGFCMGFAWALFCMWLLKRIGGGQRSQQKVEPKTA